MRDRKTAVGYELGVTVEPLRELQRRVLDEYSADGWGLARFSSISDEVQRAVANDMVVSCLEGVESALTAVALRARRYQALLGANGRTKPHAGSTLEDLIDLEELTACSADVFRGMGSALDCLAGVSILLVGMPLNAQRAEGSHLLKRPKGPSTNPHQEQLWAELTQQVSQQGSEPVDGWLAWALETRNAVIHRGRLLRMWLNRPGRKPGQPQLLVRTDEDLSSLVRMEEHLRRSPWMPDMHSLSAVRPPEELWLSEPAQITHRHILEGTVRIADSVAGLLLDSSESGLEFDWPTAKWGLAVREDNWRIQMAKPFSGFDNDYQTPPPSVIQMHPDSAKRAELAERLRRQSLGED